MADQVLQEIKDRLNIADVIGGYITIKKAGVNFKAACPFHNEKSPSLVISPQKQIWHCFGCGEGGDVFGFVTRYENIVFKDALKILADKAGVKLPEHGTKDRRVEEESERLFRINSFAARFYHELLLRDKRAELARKYLERRGLKSETIEQWQIGFAPDEFHALEQALTRKQVGLLDMVKAGVSARNERGNIYDRFRNRVVFPIYDYLGNVVGFTARILDDSAKAAKYINSPETPVYNKSKILFGLNFAKGEMRKKDEAIIVEGQMDCISAHQAGYKNVVASSGTALSESQLAQLGRLTRNLKFCFDADAAGLQATRRAVQMYLGKDHVIRIINLEGAKDPDELIKSSPEKWERLVKLAPLFLDFYLEKVFEGFDPGSVEDKKRIAAEVLPLLAHLTDQIEQEHYVQVIAGRFGSNPEILREALSKKSISQKHSPEQITAPSKRQNADVGPSSLEKLIIGGIMLFEEFGDKVLKEGAVTDFDHIVTRSLFEAFKGSKGLPLQVKDHPVAKEGVFMVESQVEEHEGGRQAVLRELEKTFSLLKLTSIKRQLKLLNTSMKQAESLKDRDKLAQLSKQFAELTTLRLKYEHSS